MEKLHIYHYKQIKNLKINGRTPVTSDGSPLPLFWTASGFTVNQTAGELWAEIESDWTTYEPWISIWVDDVQISRFMTEKGRHWVCLFRGLQPGVEHEITLKKETQAMSGDNNHMLLIHSLGIPCTQQNSVKPDNEEIFHPVRERKLKIEFVGDSITTGEGLAGSPEQMDWITGWMAHNGNYSQLLGKWLDADIRILSQSGWGVFSSYDNNRNNVLPKYYEKICGLAFGQRNEVLGAHNDYDFSKWLSDYVIVNLGTNDNGAFTNPAQKDPVTGEEWKLLTDENGNKNSEDVQLVKNAVYNFMKKIRTLNPKAKIIFCNGMCTHDLCDEIEQAVKNYAENEKDKSAYFVLLPDMQDETYEEKGSRGHPGLMTHKKAARTLFEFIEKIK